jgi:DNA-binding PadR family transcriptional regulator
MDIIILKHLKNNHPISGYDVIKYLHKSFHILPSSGTTYSQLYSLERKNLVEGNMQQGKRVYKLTEHGESFLDIIHHARNGIHQLVTSIFSEV